MYATSSPFQTCQKKIQPKPRKASSAAAAATFSSSILDSVYRTIDDADPCICRRRSAPLNPIREDPTPFRRSAVADKWLHRYQIRPPPPSSDTAAVFSSSESDHGGAGRCRPGFRYAVEEKQKKKSKKVVIEEKKQKNQKQHKEKNLKQSTETGEDALKRTKSTTMKVYDHLKKAKYPISPGRRISTFLNSLFHPSTPRPSSALHISPAAVNRAPVTGLSIKTRPVCSPEAYRPCLSKTPGGIGDRVKKSVRFSPVMGRKWEEEDSDSEDAYSCGSSDLFELENLIGVGGRYRKEEEELPVYDTTTTSGFLV